MRSTIGKSMVNEARYGAQDAMGDGTYFGKGLDAPCSTARASAARARTAKGYNFTFLSISAGGTLTSATATPVRLGVAAQTSVEDTLTWLKGEHSMSFGAIVGANGDAGLPARHR